MRLSKAPTWFSPQVCRKAGTAPKSLPIHPTSCAGKSDRRWWWPPRRRHLVRTLLVSSPKCEQLWTGQWCRLPAHPLSVVCLPSASFGTEPHTDHPFNAGGKIRVTSTFGLDALKKRKMSVRSRVCSKSYLYHTTRCPNPLYIVHHRQQYCNGLNYTYRPVQNVTRTVRVVVLLSCPGMPRAGFNCDLQPRMSTTEKMPAT